MHRIAEFLDIFINLSFYIFYLILILFFILYIFRDEITYFIKNLKSKIYGDE
jgi:hypothetical protein